MSSPPPPKSSSSSQCTLHRARCLALWGLLVASVGVVVVVRGGQPQAASFGRSVASDSVLSTRRASSLNSPARFVVRCELRGLALALAQQLTSDF
jgi:hypothetical protein